MPFMPQLWTINGLATELDMDRRAVAKLMRGVPPAGQVKGNPAWHMSHAMEALGKRGAVAATTPATTDDGSPRPPPGLQVMEEISDPFHKGFVLAHLDSVYTLQGMVAALAVGEGVKMDAAFQIATGVVTAMMFRAEEAARTLGIEPWATDEEADLYDMTVFRTVNWPNLAHRAGEPDWTPPREGVPGWPAFTAEERAANILPNEPLAGEDP